MDKIEVAKVLIQNKDGKFLIVQKSDEYDWKAGKWELPGGKIDEDENRFEAAKRETKAETDLKIEEFEDVVRVECEESDKEKPVVNCHILYSRSFIGNTRISEEHKDFKWVSAEEFIDMNWHRDAGYAIPAMQYLGKYLS